MTSQIVQAVRDDISNATRWGLTGLQETVQSSMRWHMNVKQAPESQEFKAILGYIV